MSDLKGGSTISGSIIYHHGNREQHSGRDTIERIIEGEVYVGSLMYYRVPKACKITDIVASLGGLPTGQSFIIDIRKNGTATTDSVTVSDAGIVIGTGQAASNGVYAVRCSVDSAMADLNDGDVLYFIITQVGSGLAGSDLQLVVRLI